MKHKYALPLALGLVLASQPAKDAAKDAFNYFKGSPKGIERVVQSPKTNRLEELLGAAYGQDRAEAKTYNPREEFRKLGWEVYDDTDLKKRPDRIYNTRVTPAELKINISNPNVKANFTAEEIGLLNNILDGDLANDELRYLLISKDNYLAFAVMTKNKEIGVNGIYSVQKKVSPEAANIFRQLPHLNQ